MQTNPMVPRFYTGKTLHDFGEVTRFLAMSGNKMSRRSPATSNLSLFEARLRLLKLKSGTPLTSKTNQTKPTKASRTAAANNAVSEMRNRVFGRNVQRFV
jgi:hypothetical protein